MLTWADGRSYEGDFFSGKKHGQGTHAWPDGRSYTGQWKNGVQDGRGCARTPQGHECEGLWVDGKFSEWLNGGLGFQNIEQEADPQRAVPSKCCQCTTGS